MRGACKQSWWLFLITVPSLGRVLKTSSGFPCRAPHRGRMEGEEGGLDGKGFVFLVCL